MLPRDGAWIPALAGLVAELDSGRVYDRDLPELGQALSTTTREPSWTPTSALRSGCSQGRAPTPHQITKCHWSTTGA